MRYTTNYNIKVLQGTDAPPDIEQLGDSFDTIDTVLKAKADAPTIVTGTLASGQTSLTLNNSAIKTTSVVDVYTDVYGVAPVSVTVTNGSAVLTFESRSSALNVRLEVK